MMMTAAGTVPAARVFVMGAGVAGLQAIATARRLGAVVSATDVRPAVEGTGRKSLGAKFIAVEDDEFKQAETAGGYAKPMSPEYQAKQAELWSPTHIKKQDIVITTALIPGRPAPRLITRRDAGKHEAGFGASSTSRSSAAATSRAPRPGERCEVGGRQDRRPPQRAGRIAASASALYAKNLLAFLETMVDKENKALAVELGGRAGQGDRADARRASGSPESFQSRRSEGVPHDRGQVPPKP
jgi:NAD(P) transhydrogenase subunit alpha